MSDDIDFSLKVGDLLPVIEATLLDDEGSAIPLTGATVTFRMRLESADSGTLKVNAAATVVDAPTGRVRYTWTGTDTDTAGRYVAEFRASFAAGQMTVPNDSFIRVNIGPTA